MEYVDYEKLHKDTIAKLQEMVNSGKITVETARGICADFVPESEDERIRKAIIKHFEKERKESRKVNYYGVDVFDILAWLKDQKCIDVLDEEEKEFADDVDAFRKECDAAYQRGYNEGVRVTLEKQEWGEKDKGIIDTIIWTLIDREVKEGHPDEYEPEVNWLKSLKDRVQPKQEWSAEDKKILDDIIDSGKHACFLTVKQTEWLETLRPQNKTYYWTENEIKFAISDYIRGAESYEKMVEKLRCLKPQSRWKPSDEQMKALWEVYKGGEEQAALASLYSDLKELKG